MALTLTIGGTNFLPQYKTNSARITERLNNAANTLRLEVVKKKGSGSVPSEGQEIVFKDGSRFLFGGYISLVDPTETGEGEQITYSIEATDYTYILINKMAQKSYEDKTLAYIVNDLLSTYVDSGYAFTDNNVETGPTISTISFNHISLRKSFEKLAGVTGYKWYVDYEKDVHFFANDSTLAPEDFTDSSDNFYSVDIAIDTSQVRNSIVVRGGREETSSSFSQDFAGDGEAREWILREKPKTMVSIEENISGGGFSSKAFGVDPIDDDTGYDYMFNYQEKYVRATATTTTLTTADVLRVTYNYEVPVIVKLRSSTSINSMKALEGGDGIHDHIINRPDVTSKAEAREIALNEIEEYGNPLLTAVVKTRSGLLSSGSIFKTGQVVTVNLPTWGISSDTQYQIQQVEVSLSEDGSNIEYNYVVTFGGRLIGIREFLEGLAGEEKVILDTEEIDRIEAFEDVIPVTESIGREPNTESENAEVSFSESTTDTEVTPPFKWAPYSSPATLSAKWNKFEWS